MSDSLPYLDDALPDSLPWRAGDHRIVLDRLPDVGLRVMAMKLEARIDERKWREPPSDRTNGEQLDTRMASTRNGEPMPQEWVAGPELDALGPFELFDARVVKREPTDVPSIPALRCLAVEGTVLLREHIRRSRIQDSKAAEKRRESAIQRLRQSDSTPLQTAWTQAAVSSPVDELWATQRTAKGAYTPSQSDPWTRVLERDESVASSGSRSSRPTDLAPRALFTSSASSCWSTPKRGTLHCRQ